VANGQESQHLILTPADGQLQLELRCRHCGFKNQDAGYAFSGTEAERMLRRVLAYHNFAGAKEDRVKEAVRVIDQAGSPEARWPEEQLAAIGDGELTELPMLERLRLKLPG
jgi:hypothetical protein